MSYPTTLRESYLQLLESKASIDARFTNLRRLGTDGGGGHFSLMLTATDTSTKATIALKFFNPEQLGDPYRVESFRRECELLAELADPRYLVEMVAPQSEFNVVLSAEGNILFPLRFTYYGMRLANGSVLGEVAKGKLTTLQALDVFGQMCRAVQYLHVRGTVHRDLKPENFLMFQGGDVRLADLGAARRLADSPLLPTYAGMPPGDRRYTSPELIASLHDDDPTIAIGADFFALGAVLYELLTGLVLTVQLFDQAFLMRLLTSMAAIPASRRRSTYDAIADSIADAHPLPTLASSPRLVRGSVRPRLDNLFQSLASIDYRSRLTDFRSVFRQIEICRIVLRNEDRHKRWLDAKRRRRSGGGKT